jgi:hypothetical protein
MLNGDVTSNVCTTCGAAAYPGLPAWSAAIEHVPRATRLTCTPDTVQVADVNELNVIGFPEAPPVALAMKLPPAVAGFGALPNDMNCVRSLRLRPDGMEICPSSLLPQHSGVPFDLSTHV